MADEAVAVDVGGTKVAVGVVAATGAVGERHRFDTPAGDADALVDAIVAAVTPLLGSGRPVGVGAAGFVDLDGTVKASPNVPGLVQVPLRRRLAERLDAPVTVANDADAAAWAEFRVGAGRDVDDLVMLTVGTGVGGGLVQAGQLRRGAHGGAGELGHIIIDEGGPRCACGNRGCLEAHASGTALARKATERRERHGLADGSPLARGVLTGEAVTAAAVDGDAEALELLADVGGWLGVGMASLANAIDPGLVVLGGGALAAGDLLVEPARRACQARLLGGDHRPPVPVAVAELGSEAGLVGSGLLACEP